MALPTKRVLFISNGHGEDLNASECLKVFRQKYPSAEVAALPIVGEGNAYRRLGVEIVGPTKALPSGGFVYMDRFKLLADLRSGLISLLLRQIKAAIDYGKTCDLVFAAGDIVSLALARLTGCDYTAFIVSASAHYENRMQPDLTTSWLLRSPKCKTIFTRDAFTAKLMSQQGIDKAVFAGYPIMDVLAPTGKDLELEPNVPTIAFLPGSRLPEACNNFGILLDLAVAIAQEFAPQPVQFRAALVPSMMRANYQKELDSKNVDGAHGRTPLEEVAISHSWRYEGRARLYHDRLNSPLICYDDAFPDVLRQADLVIGMAGTAIEQAVGLGKPVIQIPSKGPQFTYHFADAQMRLLGASVQTIGKKPANAETITIAAKRVKEILADQEYLQSCQQNGLERVGLPGGSEGISDRFAQILWGDQLQSKVN
ncbi:hypothetical protein Pse7367_1180 [Thalassoporum mexicanum PCC 7367]|uniref:lipid-A-disaccharide synthase-related protein n=1 Tax=Thalassoporum mexicanum TaxID=3457544 RepID=UPI00029F8DCF|nr:lipid-A-disaccharide synthase-related protein [Pseudanabaena sp. PCC 7367]AFY69477.1 hypothetical protein Pse7367_1180 [Pseudanabaena sp. PCC 7367]